MLFTKMLYIFSKVKVYLDQLAYGFNQNCSEELKLSVLVLVGYEVLAKSVLKSIFPMF